MPSRDDGGRAFVRCCVATATRMSVEPMPRATGAGRPLPADGRRQAKDGNWNRAHFDDNFLGSNGRPRLRGGKVPGRSQIATRGCAVP